MVYFGGFFAKLGHFAGFSLHIINLAVRISAAMMVGVKIHFLGCRIPFKGAMDGARGGEYYISKPLWSSGEINVRLWQPEFGPEENHFVSGNFAGFSLYISSEGSA